jgi:hypothetical protein
VVFGAGDFRTRTEDRRCHQSSRRAIGSSSGRSHFCVVAMALLVAQNVGESVGWGGLER